MLKTFSNDDEKLNFINTNNKLICSTFTKNIVFNDYGLQNLGNTCYIAAILKALSCSNNFVDFLIKTFDDFKILFSSYKEYKLFESYIKLLNDKEVSILIRWLNFYNALPESQLRYLVVDKNQQDAHEFLLKFFAYLEECIFEAQLVKRGVGDNENYSEIINEMSSKDSLLDQFFNGSYQLVYTGIKITTRPENEAVLMLDILDKDSNSNDLSLLECLRKSFRYSVQMEMNGSKQEANVKKKILKLNQILIIQLKLFKVMKFLIKLNFFF